MQRDVFSVNPVGNDFEVVGDAGNYNMRMAGTRRVAFCTHKHDADCIAEALNYMESIGWEKSNKHMDTTNITTVNVTSVGGVLMPDGSLGYHPDDKITVIPTQNPLTIDLNSGDMLIESGHYSTKTLEGK